MDNGPPSEASQTNQNQLTRRHLLAAAGGWSALAALSSCATTEQTARESSPSRKSRVLHSIPQWCFGLFGEKWSLAQTCQVAKKLGASSIDLLPPEDFQTVKDHGLVCGIANNGMPAPPFKRGFNNPQYHDELIRRARNVIDACAKFGFPNMVTFTGYARRDPDDPQSEPIPPEVGADNCVKGFKRLMQYAEAKNVTVCLEILNSRVDSHPMKGHPGYQGDHTDYCIDIIKRVGSPNLKLLFDVYHAQIMDGDLITRIRQYSDYIGHVHTAGVPGRNELDDTQEINYPAVIRALMDEGYAGYVAHEFIPTGEPTESIRQAIQTCDV